VRGRGGGARALLLEPVIVASGAFVVRHTLRLEPVPAPHRDAVEAAFACARECEALRSSAAAAAVPRPAPAAAAPASTAPADYDDEDEDEEGGGVGGGSAAVADGPFARAFDAAHAAVGAVPRGAHDGKRARR